VAGEQGEFYVLAVAAHRPAETLPGVSALTISVLRPGIGRGTRAGSSPRVLLYFFGSKEGLVRAVLIRSRDNQYRLVEQWLAEASSPADRIERLWQWPADPEQAGVERLFFESYARSLHDEDGAWAGFGKTVPARGPGQPRPLLLPVEPSAGRRSGSSVAA
jgi:hypothetical protein